MPLLLCSCAAAAALILIAASDAVPTAEASEVTVFRSSADPFAKHSGFVSPPAAPRTMLRRLDEGDDDGGSGIFGDLFSFLADFLFVNFGLGEDVSKSKLADMCMARPEVKSIVLDGRERPSEVLQNTNIAE